MQKCIKRHPLAAYFALAYAFSWSAWGVLAAARLPPGPSHSLLLILGGFGPAVSAFCVASIAEGTDGVQMLKSRLFRWRVALKWYAWALLVPIVLFYISYLAYRGAGGQVADTGVVPPAYAYPVLLIYVFFLGGGQEEPGWRGYALPYLLTKYSPLSSSLILGVFWVMWHLPLFFLPDAAQASIPFGWYVLNGIALSVIFTYLFCSTSGSVPLAMLLHAGVNAPVAWFPMRGIPGMLQPYAALTLVSCVFGILLMSKYGWQRFVRKLG